MKKPLALLLSALLFLAPARALAAGVKYETYRNKAGGYSIDYPAEWTLLSEEAIRSAVDSLAGGAEGGADASAAGDTPNMEPPEDVMFLSPDGAATLNVSYQAVPAQYKSGDIVKTVCPAVLQQLESVLEGFTPQDEAKVEKAGKLEFVEASGRYALSGADFVMLQAYYCSKTTLYILTCTVNRSMNPDMDALRAIFDAMLASFAPA